MQQRYSSMRPDEILTWVRARPSFPSASFLNSGRMYEVRHPALVKVLRESVQLFTPKEQAGVYDRVQMLGLGLIERIEPLPVAANTSGGNGLQGS